MVAVLTFDAADYKSLQQGDRAVRDFERTYLAARLVRSLKARPEFAAVYLSRAWTPAADYNVKGTIEKSDGKMTVVRIAVSGADGRSVWSRSFNVNTSSEELKRQADPTARLWAQIATAVAATKQKPGDFAVARTIGYSGQKSIAVNQERARVSQVGAEAERLGLLEPSTKQFVASATAADPLYLLWQRTSTPLVEQRSGEKAAQTMSVVSGLLGGFAAGLGASTGNTQLTSAGANLSTTASNNYDVSQAKIVEINKTLLSTSQQFNVLDGKPASVTLFGKSYTFTGSKEKQQADLRKVVAKKIAEMPG